MSKLQFKSDACNRRAPRLVYGCICRVRRASKGILHTSQTLVCNIPLLARALGLKAKMHPLGQARAGR